MTSNMRNIITLILLIIFQSVKSQGFNVNYFHGDNTVNNVEIVNDNVYIGGFLGLTRINRYNLEDKEIIIEPFVELKPYWNCFSIFLDKGTANNLYINSTQNLLQYDEKVFSLIQKDLYISDFYVDENNTIWILSPYPKNALLKIENNEVEVFSVENSSLPDYNYSCLCARNNTVWLGTSSYGLIEFKDGAITEYNIDNSDLPFNSISSIDVNSNGLWLSCYTEGNHPNYDEQVTFVHYTENNWEIFNRSNSSLPETWINNIVAYDDFIFICSTNGLIKIHDSNWQFYTISNNSIISNNVTAVAYNQDEIWIGTTKGLSLIRSDSTTNIKIATPFSGSYYQGPIVEDLEGNIWIGTGGTSGNLCKFDGQTWTEILPKGTDNNPQSFCGIAVDSNNVIWATVYSFKGGVYRIDGDSITKFDESNSPVPYFSGSIIVDNNNNKWIISGNKTLKYNDTIWTVFNHSEFPGYPFHGGPKCITCDQSGNIWLGMHQSGMFKYDGINWIHYDDSFFGNESSEVNKIIVDSENNLWIDYSHGTIEPKLCKFDGSNLTWYDSNINLPPKGHGLMAIEENGDIWYHSYGLFKYDGTEWIDYSPQNTRLINGQCWAFFIDSKNNKWISSDCYIAEFNEGSLYHEDSKYKQTNSPKFTIYPNPLTNQSLFIKTNYIILGDIEISIYNITGELLNKSFFSNKSDFTIDLGNIKGNLLFIQFIENGKTETHKLIKY